MTPAALCVLDTKNQHSALTVQCCLSAHSEVLSLTTKAIFARFMSSYNRQNVNTSHYIAHLLNKNWTVWIWSYVSKCSSQFWWLLCFPKCCVVTPPIIFCKYNITFEAYYLSNPISDSWTQTKKAPPSRPVLFKNRPGLAASECPGTAVHLQCAPASKPGPGHQALGSEQGAAHKWVMAVTLTFGGRAG